MTDVSSSIRGLPYRVTNFRQWLLLVVSCFFIEAYLCGTRTCPLPPRRRGKCPCEFTVLALTDHSVRWQCDAQGEIPKLLPNQTNETRQ